MRAPLGILRILGCAALGGEDAIHVAADAGEGRLHFGGRSARAFFEVDAAQRTHP
jgi:hypothetical protein